jgi:uncharacterized protein (DUF2147 family)
MAHRFAHGAPRGIGVRRRYLQVRFLTVVWFLAASAVSAYAADPFGTWLTGDGQARIRVDRCGGNLCGTIVWLKEPIDRATGKPEVDDKNPDPKKQKRPIIGLRIFSMKPADSGAWSGSIYNADDGKNYAATVTPQSQSSLVVRGCAGVFCGDDTWTRVGAEKKQ